MSEVKIPVETFSEKIRGRKEPSLSREVYNWCRANSIKYRFEVELDTSTAQLQFGWGGFSLSQFGIMLEEEDNVFQVQGSWMLIFPDEAQAMLFKLAWS